MNRFGSVKPDWRQHPYHGELLDDFAAAGGFAICPDGAERKVIRWMVETYLGEPGRYGTFGRNRAVFYSDTAASRIERILREAPPPVKDLIDLAHLLGYEESRPVQDPASPPAIHHGKKTRSHKGATSRPDLGAEQKQDSGGEAGMDKRQIIKEIARLCGEEPTPERYEKLLDLLGQAFKGDAGLSRDAEQALWEFAKTMVKEEGISINSAAQKYLIPERSLSSWANLGLIPVLYRDKGATYLDQEAVAQAAHIYREAKERGIQPVRLLRERLGK